MAARVDLRQLRPEEQDLRRVVDPDQQQDQRSRRAVGGGHAAASQVEPDAELPRREQAGRCVEPFLDDRREGAAKQREFHLVGDAFDLVADFRAFESQRFLRPLALQAFDELHFRFFKSQRARGGDARGSAPALLPLEYDHRSPTGG